MDYKKLDKLLADTGRGDNAAFAEFYKLTIKGVYVFVYSYVKNRTLAEDLAQDTFVQVKLKAYTYKEGTNPRAWLLQIAKNLSIDELRRQKRTGSFEADEKAIENAATKTYDKAALSYMLKELDDEKREIVILHVFWGLKHREIAEKLQMPLGTILWKYNEAIKILKKYEENL